MQVRLKIQAEAERKERYRMSTEDPGKQAEETDEEEDDFECDICGKEIDIYSNGRYTCLVC
ncbi:unnamed protein product, partial [Heterosigma akashiwo]